jgi:hypothetical protein
MKKTMIRSMMALAMIVAVSTAANATTNNNEPVTEIKTAGIRYNQPVYELNIKNENYAEYLITVTDENGIVLYEENVSGVNITRKFQLNKTELGTTGVVFEVTGKNNKPAVFTIKNNIIAKEDSTAGLSSRGL